MADYVPAEMVITGDMVKERESVAGWARDLVAEDV